MAPVQGGDQLADAPHMDGKPAHGSVSPSHSFANVCRIGTSLPTRSPPRHRCSQVGVFSCK